MHKWHILWALHKVHHSATTLTPMTVFRTHPLEGVIFSFRGAITQAVTISSFIFLFGSNVDLFTVLGANIFTFLFNIFGLVYFGDSGSYLISILIEFIFVKTFCVATN